jgi:hypothetical protein
VTVLAPYYDDDGAALADIARRYPVPVTCWMQTGREGLARDAAAGLPPNVMLRSVEVPEERRPSFIHAKVLAFHRDEDVVLAVGSANCSRAALLAGEDRSNAELMALEAVSHERFEALLAELVRSPAAPVLPERPPSEDWPEPETPVLRILAARQAAGVLEVAFRPAEPLASLSVQALEGAWSAEAEWEQGVARAAVSVRLRAARIVGVTLAGMEIASDEVWVDDEVSLAAPATLRRMFNRMLDMGSPQTDPAEAFRGVLEIFRDYLRDPEASRRRMRRREHGEGSPRPYDPAAVFADDFGSLGVPALRNTYGRREPVSILAILEALFSVSREVGATPQPPLPLSDEEGEGDGDGEDGARSGSPPDLLSPPLKWVLDKRAKAQLRRALAAVESALMDEAFVAARSPELLGADLALAAILLVKGLSDRLLDPQDYREATRRLWTTLFFGENGVPGRVPARIAALTGAGQRIAFVAAIASPRLSAALTLWCMTEWAAGDAECLAFRLSAARLQLVQPWLFAGAPPDVLATEVASQAEILLPSNDQAMAARTWVELVRAGEALRILAVALESRIPPVAAALS